MTSSLVLVSQSGPTRCLQLNRPEVLNSFNAEMHAQLMSELDAAASDASVRCLVLAGSGRAFCAGQDLSDPMAAPPADLGDLIERLYVPLVTRLRSMPVPVVARVQGAAAGAGASLALCCDLVVAGRSASFIQAFSRIGLVPDVGGTWLLPRLVGGARAMGLAMLGDKLGAEEAQRIGLIWQCVPDDELDAAVDALAARLAALPTRALVATRQAMHASQGLGLLEAVSMEARVQSELGKAGDFLEGVAAFQGRRAPVFTDR